MSIQNPQGHDTWFVFEPFPADNLPMPPVPEQVMPDTGRKAKTTNVTWSPNQLAVIYDAIRNAHGERIATDKIAKAVNKLAEGSDGGNHTPQACATKIFRITFKENLKKAIDPTGEMSQGELKVHMRKPIEGRDLEKLTELLNSGVSINKIALELGRSVSVCNTAIKYLKQEGMAAPLSFEEAEEMAMEKPGRNALDEGFLASENAVLNTTESESSGKREIYPEAEGAQSKRVKVDTLQLRRPKKTWSENQIKVLIGALEDAGDKPIVNYGPIVDRINALATEGDGGFHNKQACQSKMSKFKLELKIRTAIDPMNPMSQSEVESQMRMPIEGRDLERLDELLKSGMSVPEVALELGKSVAVCNTAIRKLKRVSADAYGLMEPKPSEQAEVMAMEEPGQMLLAEDFLAIDFGPFLREFELLKATESESSVERKSDLEAESAQTARVEVETVQPMRSVNPWSDNQINVLLAALREANGKVIRNYDPIVRSINALAANEDGGFHSAETCKSKLSNIKLELKISMAIDPSGTMSASSIKAQMNKPVEGHDLDFLIQLHKKGASMEQMALSLMRKPYYIRKALKAANPS